MRPSDYEDLATGAAPETLPLPYAHEVTVLGAIFAQQIWHPAEWLTINAGARLDMDSQFGLRLSPRGSVVVTPVESTSIRASYAEAFRAPTTFELFEADRTYRPPALDLEPEIVRTADLEWRQDVSFVELSLRGFFAFYEDIIASRLLSEEEFAEVSQRFQFAPTIDSSYIPVYDNVSAFRSFGGTAGLTLRPVDGLTIAGSFTIYDSVRFDRSDPPGGPDVESDLVLLPVWSGNARVSYELSHDGIAFAIASRFAANRLAPDAPEGETGPGMQLDLRATFSAPIEPVDGLRLRASFGYSVNPFLPYHYAGDVEPPVPFMQVRTPMFGLLEATYEIAP